MSFNNNNNNNTSNYPTTFSSQNQAINIPVTETTKKMDSTYSSTAQSNLPFNSQSAMNEPYIPYNSVTSNAPGGLMNDMQHNQQQAHLHGGALGQQDKDFHRTDDKVFHNQEHDRAHHQGGVDIPVTGDAQRQHEYGDRKDFHGEHGNKDFKGDYDREYMNKGGAIPTTGGAFTGANQHMGTAGGAFPGGNQHMGTAGGAFPGGNQHMGTAGGAFPGGNQHMGTAGGAFPAGGFHTGEQQHGEHRTGEHGGVTIPVTGAPGSQHDFKHGTGSTGSFEHGHRGDLANEHHHDGDFKEHDHKLKGESKDHHGSADHKDYKDKDHEHKLKGEIKEKEFKDKDYKDHDHKTKEHKVTAAVVTKDRKSGEFKDKDHKDRKSGEFKDHKDKDHKDRKSGEFKDHKDKDHKLVKDKDYKDHHDGRVDLTHDKERMVGGSYPVPDHEIKKVTADSHNHKGVGIGGTTDHVYKEGGAIPSDHDRTIVGGHPTTTATGVHPTTGIHPTTGAHTTEVVVKKDKKNKDHKKDKALKKDKAHKKDKDYKKNKDVHTTGVHPTTGAHTTGVHTTGVHPTTGAHTTVVDTSDRVHGDQTEFKKQEAQLLLKQLQEISSGDMMGTRALDEILGRAENIILRTAQRKDVDNDTSRTLEDLAALVQSVKHVAKKKDVADRLQSISSETQQAMAEIGRPGSSGSHSTDEASRQALAFVQTWRTLFQLMMSSREFRTLLVDFISIVKRIFMRHSDGLGTRVKEEYLSGKSSSEIANTVTQHSKVNAQAPTGEYEVKITEEEAEQLRSDLTRIVAALGRNPNFREGVRRIFDLLDMARDQAKTKVRKQGSKPEVNKAKPHALQAQKETEDLIACFSGRETLNNFMRSLRRLITKAEQDQETREYLEDVRNFILKESATENVDERNLRIRSSQLIDRGRDLIDKYRYADEVNNFLNCSDELLENIANDEFISILKHHAGIVANDLSYTDDAGVQHIDTEMLGKIRSVIVPIIADSLKYIPMTRIEGSDEKKDFWIDNIVLCAYDIIPDRVRVQIESDSELSVRDIEVKKAYTRLVVTLKEIRTELKDVDFYFHKKSFPEMTESGRFTLRLGGDGASLVITFNIEQTAGDPQPRLTNGNADFHIHKMDIEFDKSSLHHSVLVPMTTGLFKSRIQRTIESGVENNLQKMIDNIGVRLTESLAQVNRPLVSRLEAVKRTMQATEVAQTYEKRREKLE